MIKGKLNEVLHSSFELSEYHRFSHTKKSQDQLRKTNIFLDSIVENIPHMIFLKDAKNLRFVRLNRAAEELLGFSQEELIGKSDYDFFPKEQADFFVSKDREVIENRTIVDIPEEPVHTRNKGVRFLHTKKIPLFDDEGNPIYLLGISEDITEIKRMREEEAIMRAHLVQTEKLTSLGLLAAGIAHELNNPLTGMLSLLRSFRKNLDKDSTDYQIFTEMLEASDHMARIVEDLNAFSRVSKEKYKAVDLHDVIESVFSFSRHYFLKKGISVNKHYHPGLPRIYGNAGKLKQVVLNLLTNASGAMPDGGELIIKTGISRNMKKVFLEVADTGTGIDPQNISKVFDPFFTTKPVGEGTGLGLSVLHGIVKNHKGDVWVGSNQGQGAKFIVTFPVLEAGIKEERYASKRYSYR